MARVDQSRPRSSSSATLNPMFPLILLETMRDMDRPDEVLEDEDVSISMPRRLGLSDVVGVQIRRFREEVRQKRPQSAASVEDLIRLVIRRPDAEAIFEEAGRRLARHAWDQRTGAMRGTIRVLPGPLARVSAHRAARRLFSRLAGGGKLTVTRWPSELKIQDSITARADPSGAACAFYGGAFAELLQFYTGRSYRVRHPECGAHGASHCHWTLEVAA